MTAPMTRLDEIVREAGRIAVAERANIVRSLKPDGSVVTNGDHAVETFLRSVLPVEWPGTTVWGEEFGWEPVGPHGIWLLDPVDGTTNYAMGSPLWGVSIGLMSGTGVMSLGAVDLPDLRETYVGAFGEGAWANGDALPPIAPGPIHPWEAISYGEWIVERYGRPALPFRMRVSGAFVIDGTFALRGRYRGLIGDTESLYDVSACVLMARELGMDVRYIDGEPFRELDLCRPGRIPGPWVIMPQGSDIVLPRTGR